MAVVHPYIQILDEKSGLSSLYNQDGMQTFSLLLVAIVSSVGAVDLSPPCHLLLSSESPRSV